MRITGKCNTNKELKIMYEDIREQIKIGKEERQQILILVDFNAKIGAAREDNKTQVTKGGRELLNLGNTKTHDDIKHCQRKVQRSMEKSGERRKVYN